MAHIWHQVILGFMAFYGGLAIRSTARGLDPKTP